MKIKKTIAMLAGLAVLAGGGSLVTKLYHPSKSQEQLISDFKTSFDAFPTNINGASVRKTFVPQSSGAIISIGLAHKPSYKTTVERMAKYTALEKEQLTEITGILKILRSQGYNDGSFHLEAIASYGDVYGVALREAAVDYSKKTGMSLDAAYESISFLEDRARFQKERPSEYLEWEREFIQNNTKKGSVHSIENNDYAPAGFTIKPFENHFLYVSRLLAYKQADRGENNPGTRALMFLIAEAPDTQFLETYGNTTPTYITTVAGALHTFDGSDKYSPVDNLALYNKDASRKRSLIIITPKKTLEAMAEIAKDGIN